MKRLTLGQVTAVVHAVDLARVDHENLRADPQLNVAMEKLEQTMVVQREAHKARRARKRQENTNGSTAEVV